MTRHAPVSASGLGYAALAYVMWGLFPLYFMQVARVPPFEVVLHRSVWALMFVLALLVGLRRLGALAAAFAQPRLLALTAVSALLLSGNWMVYVWSVQNGHVLDASLGYFINPLVNVLLGVLLLRERLRPAQWLAVAIAAAGVLWLGWQAGRMPWIALALALSFGFYGLIRKTAPLGPIEGLALETLLLAPLAAGLLGWWTWRGDSALATGDPALLGWLLLAGPLTALPLMFFAAGARRLPLATLGLMQYLSPSIQFGLGVWLFREPFGRTQLIGFGLIWLALLVYSTEALVTGRQRAAEATPA